jgi:hypothetical protein
MPKQARLIQRRDFACQHGARRTLNTARGCNSKLREYVVPQKPIEEQENPKPKAYSMTWAQRLKRVFAIDIEKCEKCGGPVRIIASIEDPDVIQKILKHLGLDQPVDTPIRSPPSVLTDHSMTLF